MEYIINVWKDSSTNGTACLFRTKSKAEFDRMREKLVKKYKPYKKLVRIMEFKNRTIFSFADNGKGYFAWIHTEFTRSPIKMEYIKL